MFWDVSRLSKLPASALDVVLHCSGICRGRRCRKAWPVTTPHPDGNVVLLLVAVRAAIAVTDRVDKHLVLDLTIESPTLPEACLSGDADKRPSPVVGRRYGSANTVVPIVGVAGPRGAISIVQIAQRTGAGLASAPNR